MELYISMEHFSACPNMEDLKSSDPLKRNQISKYRYLNALYSYYIA